MHGTSTGVVADSAAAMLSLASQVRSGLGWAPPTGVRAAESVLLHQDDELPPKKYPQGWTSAAVAFSVGLSRRVATASALPLRQGRGCAMRGVRSASGSRISLQANPAATFETTIGTFVAEIYLDKMPITASNFIDLCRTGFYEGLHFHRVIPNFMAQFGCPLSKEPKSLQAGMGGPEGKSAFTLLDSSGALITRNAEGSIPDELIDRSSNEPGTLSMANAGPNSGGSQFFINMNHNKTLDWFDDTVYPEVQHPVFGRVIEGYALVVQIAEVPTDGYDCPAEPIMLKKITIAGIDDTCR